MNDERPPTPESRARGHRPRGIPIELSDGRTWVLARGGTREALDPVRDVLYADVVLGGKAPVIELLWTALALLLANYDLGRDEAEALLDGVGPAALADAVMDALFGEEAPERTFSAWQRVMLRSNAIDPAAVPPEELPWVLEMLIASGRAIPAERWADAGKAAGRFREARELAEANHRPSTPAPPG